MHAWLHKLGSYNTDFVMTMQLYFAIYHCCIIGHHTEVDILPEL